jgi:hypothetical protein
MDPIKQSENSRLEVGQGEFFELLEWLFKSGVAIGIDQWLRKTARSPDEVPRLHGRWDDPLHEGKSHRNGGF